MNEVQKIIRRAIEEVKTTRAEYQQKKWRNKVIDRLEEVEALASKVPNPEHPHNQPLPESEGDFRDHHDYDLPKNQRIVGGPARKRGSIRNPIDDDEGPINLDDIPF